MIHHNLVISLEDTDQLISWPAKLIRVRLISLFYHYCNVLYHLSASSSAVHSQNTPTTSSSNSLSPTLYPPSQFIEENSVRNSESEEGDEFSLVSNEEDQQKGHRRCQRRLPAVEPLQRQLWGRRGDDFDSPHDSNQTADDEVCVLDMLPQDPALILPDQVDFYAQIKVEGSCSEDALICTGFFMVQQWSYVWGTLVINRNVIESFFSKPLFIVCLLHTQIYLVENEFSDICASQTLYLVHYSEQGLNSYDILFYVLAGLILS